MLEEALGLPPVMRLGEEFAADNGFQFPSAPSPGSEGDADRSSQRDFMTHAMFDVDALKFRTGPEGRVIFVCFPGAVEVILRRLLEANSSSGAGVARSTKFENIFVVVLSFPREVIPTVEAYRSAFQSCVWYLRPRHSLFVWWHVNGCRWCGGRRHRAVFLCVGSHNARARC